MAKSSAKRRSIAPPARRSVPPPAPERRSHPPAARRSVPPPPARTSTRPPPPARTSTRPPAPAAPAPSGRRRARGAAPWAARHAAKHAAEAAARNLEPPRPGSARATLRTPEQAEAIKARVMELHDKLTRIRAMKKQLPDRFFEIGALLRHIRDGKLFDAKGYASFESFVEREIDLGSRILALRLARIPEVFQEEAARASGLDALLAALEALEQAPQKAQRPAARPPAPSRGR
ncbi:MAG: hypothetical protein QM756_15800 [Polyangiaceae bacterium]